MTGPPPLVSIGIPTYNRSAPVRRAIRSALGQDHPELEVVVSDDGSTDDTAEVVGAIAESDPRLRLIVQPANLGHARNFDAVLQAARGEYFMWLSDDDWLDAGYVSRCLGALREHGDVLVCGLARYHAGGRHAVDERPTDLLAERPGARVIAYFARVNVNGALFGVARRDDLRAIGFADAVGGDWRLVSGLAARGRVRTVRDVHIHRSMEGLSSDAEQLARSFGMAGARARHHHVVLAGRLAREIASGAPPFAPLPIAERVVVAPLVALLIVVRFPGIALARRILERLGLDSVEPRVTAWVRSRDR
jgi:glycosyltransferase involved in cell wall biosynthesis